MRPDELEEMNARARRLEAEIADLEPGLPTAAELTRPKPPPSKHGLRFDPIGPWMDRAEKLPPRAWIAPSLMPSTGRVLVVAESSVGKTFWALACANNHARAGGSVLLVLEEGGAKSICNRLAAMRFDRSARIEILHMQGFSVANQKQCAAIAEWMRTHERPLVVVDCWTEVFKGNENDTQETNQGKDALEGIVRANPLGALLLLHHSGKGGTSSGMYTARGSTVIPGWADYVVGLKYVKTQRGAGLVAFHAEVLKDRDGDQRGYRAKVSINLRSGEVAIAEAPKGEGDPGDEDKGGGLKTSIVDAVKSGPKSLNDLQESLGKRRETISDALNELHRANVIFRRGQKWVQVVSGAGLSDPATGGTTHWTDSRDQ